MFQRIQDLREEEGEQEALTRTAVRDLLWLTLAWGLFRPVSIQFLQKHPEPAVPLMLVRNVFVLIIPFFLWRAGRFFQAAWCMAIAAALLAGAYVFVSGGIRSSGSIAQISIGIAATIILGKQGALFISLPIVVYLSGITVFQATGGQLPQLLPESFWMALINVIAAGTVAFVPILAALGWVRRMSAKHHRIAGELQASNLRIEGLANALEGSQKLEAQLRLENSRLLHTKSIARLGSFSRNPESDKVLFSAQVYRILGSAPAVLFDDRYVPEPGEDATGGALCGDEEKVRAAWRNLIAKGREMDVTFRWRRPDDEVRHISIKGYQAPDADGKRWWILGVIQDVTDHRQTVERLRQLTEHQERAREEERTRIAREIHDELGQQLTGLKMRAAWTARQLDASPERANLSEARAELSAIGDALESTIRTVGRIASELRPPVLDALGLIPALEWLRGTFERDYGIACIADLKCGSVTADAATTVFRVAQEALTNVARHAGAKQVRIRLTQRDRLLILDVEDDGCGMAGDSFTRQGSFGLTGIRERASLSNGSVDLLTPENGGLLLRLTLPSGAIAKEAGK